MERRLALVALLACAVVARRPRPPALSADSSASLDPFILFDDYDSYETTRPAPPRPTKSSAKVILRGKRPKVNMTIKSNDKNDLLKSTTINIESHTNFFMTKRPLVIKRKPVSWVSHQSIEVDEEYDEWAEEPVMVPLRVAGSTRRPRTTTRRLPPPPPRRTTTTTTSTSTTTTTTTTTTTQKPTIRTRPPARTQTKNTKCPPRNSGFLSSYFQNNKQKRSPKKPTKSGWFTGILSRIYNWISSSSWFGGSSWFVEPRPRRTTTTERPTTLTTGAGAGDWFQHFLSSEENDDGAYVVETNNKKPAKKSLKKHYRGYQLLRAYPDMQWKVHEMLELQEEGQGSGLMWWTQPSMNGSTDILVPPDLLVDVKDTLKSSKIEFDVVIWDLQKAIKYENPQLSKKQRLELEQLRGHPMTWRRYHRYADILRYLEYLQHSYSDIVELLPLGLSSEGLPLVAVKISVAANDTHTKEVMSKGNKKKWKLRSHMKPAVWVDAGAHAREWIAPAVATWMLHALIEGEKGLGSEYEVLNQADFYIMPVMNPDGYEHSHTHDRLWRKTRSRHEQSDDLMSWLPWNWGQSDCIGVDVDRNWDYHWNEQDSSRDPCADNYAGPHPFSEPETRAVSGFLAERRGQIKVYLSLHAYSQSWLIPSTHAHLPYADDGMLMEMGKLATAALSDMYGTKYQIGTAAEIRQPASGMSHDWAKARAGIKFSYHVDLRDSFGPYGFLLPGSQIVSTARETWQAVKAIVDNLNP